MNDREQIELAFKIYEDLKKITHPLIIYAFQRTIEEKIEKLQG